MWEAHFLFEIKDNPFFSLDSAYNKLIRSTSYAVRLNIIKNGYTVKPESTLQEKIESILYKNHIENQPKLIVDLLKQEGIIKDENC